MSARYTPTLCSPPDKGELEGSLYVGSLYPHTLLSP